MPLTSLDRLLRELHALPLEQAGSFKLESTVCTEGREKSLNLIPHLKKVSLPARRAKTSRSLAKRFSILDLRPSLHLTSGQSCLTDLYLCLSILVEEVLRHVVGQDVVEKLVGVPPHLRHLLQLLARLLFPQKVQGGGDLDLPPVVEDEEDEEAEDEAEKWRAKCAVGRVGEREKQLKICQCQCEGR